MKAKKRNHIVAKTVWVKHIDAAFNLVGTKALIEKQRKLERKRTTKRKGK